MAKKIAVLLVFICLMVGCKPVSIDSHSAANFSTAKCCSLKYFNAINISGNVHVELANGAPGIRLSGLSEDINHCYATVCDHTLYIHQDVETKNAIKIKLCVPDLTKVTTSGHAIIRIKNLKTCDLEIIAKDNSSIILNGNICVNKITQLGSGKINIAWVNSDDLEIIANGSGTIALAGRVDNLFLNLSRCAVLKAKYLRARKVVAITSDDATAYLSPLYSLSAYAIDSSTIYYYHYPKHLTIVTKNSGNVLHLGWTD